MVSLALSQILVPRRDGDFFCLFGSRVPHQSTISLFFGRFQANPLPPLVHQFLFFLPFSNLPPGERPGSAQVGRSGASRPRRKQDEKN